MPPKTPPAVKRSGFKTPSTRTDSKTGFPVSFDQTLSTEERIAGGIAKGNALGRSPSMFPLPSKITLLPNRNSGRLEVPEKGVIGYGAVIRTNFFEQYTTTPPGGPAPTAKIVDGSVCTFRQNQHCMMKHRWAVVLHVYAESFVVLPIYTHNGNGLANVPVSQHSSYLHIYDPRSFPPTKTPRPEDPSDRNLFVDIHLRERISISSYLRCDYLTSFSLRFKPVEVAGYLTPLSAQKLRNYFDRRPWDRGVGPSSSSSSFISSPTSLPPNNNNQSPSPDKNGCSGPNRKRSREVMENGASNGGGRKEDSDGAANNDNDTGRRTRSWSKKSSGGRGGGGDGGGGGGGADVGEAHVQLDERNHMVVLPATTTGTGGTTTTGSRLRFQQGMEFIPGGNLGLN